MGKMTRTRRTLIAADMARMLRELQQSSAVATSTASTTPLSRAGRSAAIAQRLLRDDQKRR